jgi:molybdopterin synthase sulfur carrier subunit
MHTPMVQIQVRFFASLRERLGVSELSLEVAEGTSVSEVWALAAPGQPLSENVLAARNLEYVRLDCRLADGDEVAFFPPVTGGER